MLIWQGSAGSVERNRPTNGGIELLLFVQQMIPYCVSGAVPGARERVSEPDRQIPVLAQVRLAEVTDSKRDGGGLAALAGCALECFVLGCHQSQGDSLAGADRGLP